MRRLLALCCGVLAAVAASGCMYMQGAPWLQQRQMIVPGANGMPSYDEIYRQLTPGQMSRIGNAYWGLTCENGQLMMSAWEDYEAKKLAYGPVNVTQKAAEDGVLTRCENDPRFEPSNGRTPAWRPLVPKGSGGDASNRSPALKPNPFLRGSRGTR